MLTRKIVDLVEIDKLTFEKVADQLKEEGYNIGKSTAHKYYVDSKSKPASDDSESTNLSSKTISGKNSRKQGSFNSKLKKDLLGDQ